MTRRFLTAGCFLDRVPDRIRFFLSSWKLWATIAILGAMASGVIAYSALKRSIRDENARNAAVAAAQSERQALLKAQHAKTRADATAAYQRCKTSRPILIRIDKFIQGEKLASRILVQNATDILAITPTDSIDHKVRKRNLARINIANGKVQAAPTLKIPTLAQCEQARDTILVDGGLSAKRKP